MHGYQSSIHKHGSKVDTSMYLSNVHWLNAETLILVGDHAFQCSQYYLLFMLASSLLIPLRVVTHALPWLSEHSPLDTWENFFQGLVTWAKITWGLKCLPCHEARTLSYYNFFEGWFFEANLLVVIALSISFPLSDCLSVLAYDLGCFPM